MDKIKKAKLKELVGIFETFLNDNPFKIDGIFFDEEQFATYCLDKLEDVEVDIAVKDAIKDQETHVDEIYPEI